MNLLGIGLGFLGYVLAYASTANHGRFATQPWLGVVADAYTGEVVHAPEPPPSSTHGASSPGTILHPSSVNA